MSEFNSADIKDIQARLIPDESFREADGEFIESNKDNKLVEAEFSRVFELNKSRKVCIIFCAWIQ